MKTVIEMAREAGAYCQHGDFNMGHSYEFQPDQLERFAELVRADEREAVLRHTTKAHDVDGNCDIVLCADIRARSNK